MSSVPDNVTDEQKKAQYLEFIKTLKKDLGIDDIVKTLDHILAFNKPGTEGHSSGPLERKVSDEDKKKLMDADDALDFLDKLGGVMVKYNILESGPSDPFLKMQQVFAGSYMELLQWQAKENMKEWQKMRYDKEHKT